MPVSSVLLSDESKSDRAYEALRHRIIMLDIEPGEAINEAALTAELGVGRTPIREALKRLENDHLVVSYPRRGTFASSVDLKDLTSISEMRLTLEPLAARKAAAVNGAPLRAEMSAAAKKLAETPDVQNQRHLLELDLRVHRLIYRTLDNPFLSDTLVRLDDLATRIWCLVRERIPNITDHVSEHITLLEAVLDGDQDRAAQFARQHVQHFEHTVRNAL